MHGSGRQFSKREVIQLFRIVKRGAPQVYARRAYVKRNAVFGVCFKGLSLYFLYQTGNLIRIKTGLDTYPIRIQTRTPLSRYPPLMITLSFASHEFAAQMLRSCPKCLRSFHAFHPEKGKHAQQFSVLQTRQHPSVMQELFSAWYVFDFP